MDTVSVMPLICSARPALGTKRVLPSVLPSHSFLLSIAGSSPAWLFPSPSAPAVVLLAVGLLSWGGGFFPLASPLDYISLQPNTPGVW